MLLPLKWPNISVRSSSMKTTKSTCSASFATTAMPYNATDAYEGLEIHPQGISAKYCPDYLLSAACNAWDKALQTGEQYGYRNAQATVLAPTGTIGLIMDCDTTGVE